MRIFLAIEFPSDIKEVIFNVQQKLRPSIQKGNFTRLDNFHLTLQFIGEVDQAGLNKIFQATEQIKNIQPFDLSLGNIGTFPKKNGEILWLGIEKSSQLGVLYSKLSESLSKFGFNDAQSTYSPHITLGRGIKFNNNVSLNNLTSIPDTRFIVSSFSVMESLRVNDILTYRALRVYDI
jgi:2'-5' RNA ligase